MTLCDAGPLFALIDTRRAELRMRCKAALPDLSAPLITTRPSFTEAMYLAGRSGGWPMQRFLWRYIRDEALVLHDLRRVAVDRMDRYRIGGEDGIGDPIGLAS